MAGRDDITREGQAQQDKDQAQGNAVKKEAEVAAACSSAKATEPRPKSHQ
ncbi:hypothetical protein [Mycobacterium lepromatosis]|nr:hypothetical protein [Mycobacterium lepromatosis]